MHYLIIVNGFIGDILFASSIAERLKIESTEPVVVDYLIPLPQPLLLLKQNPFIDNVFVGVVPAEYAEKIHVAKKIYIGQVNQAEPATIQMQRFAGVKEPRVEYKVYVPESYQDAARHQIASLKLKHPNKKIVAWQADWQTKAYQTTWEQYWQIPKVGGPHRDIDTIIGELDKDFVMVEVGLPPGINQTHPKALSAESYAQTAAFIQQCDWMIGSEGGLTNLAAGVGTKCIITTCFIWQLYGKNGFIRQIENPQMGPAVYFPGFGHEHLEPFISDIEVAKRIKEHIYGH